MDVLDNATKGLASDILLGTPCSIELPAGTGKTQLIAAVASLAGDLGKRTLILTHTNAGVTVIKNRLRRFGVNQSTCSVATICSWAEKVSRAYPLLSGISIQIERTAPDYYSRCVMGAAKLCSCDAFASVLSASYSLILIDEYQDCDMSQHRLAIALRDAIGSVAVFGDRLQRIFNFRHQQFPDWQLDVESSFAPIGIVDPKPHRWETTNPDLGRWLLEYVRPELMAGRGLDFETLSIPNVRHITSGQSQSELIQNAYTMRSKCESAAVLCPNLPLAYSENLSKRLAGSFELVEEVEGRFAREQSLSSPFRAIQGRRLNGFPNSPFIATHLFRKFLISQFSPRYKKADHSTDTCPRKRAKIMLLCLRNCSLHLMISMEGGSRKPAIPSAYVAGPILSDERPGMTLCSPLGRTWPQGKIQRPFLNVSRQATDFERQAQSHSRFHVCF